MRRKCKGLFKRFVSLTLTFAMLLISIQLPARAESAILHIPEIEIGEDILSSDVFYLTATNAQLQESGGNRYLLRIARGGDCSSESGVTVKIADLTAKYGKDYTVSLYETNVKADNPKDNESLLERIEGEDYIESELLSEDEYAQMLEGDEALQKQTAEAVQDAIDYIETESGLKDTNLSQESVSAEQTGADAETNSAEAAEGNGEEITTDAGDEQAGKSVEHPEENISSVEENTEITAEVSDDEENININPLQYARQMYTGVSGESQKVTATTDMMQQIQQMANVITNAVVGANLTVDFAAGEREKYIAIDVKDNNEGDGDRYFYLMLGETYGTTTNSAASSCAVTIVDDEEQAPAEIGFSKSNYTADSESVTVEVKRTGAINTIVAAHLTAEGNTAQISRDFSAVDMDVVFPIGIDTRTVEIPIRTEYLVGEADFKLKLEAVDGCEITQDAATVTIVGSAGLNTDDGVQLMAIEESGRVSDIVLGSALDLSNPVKKGNYDHYDGSNRWTGKEWYMEWIDNVWWGYWDGGVGASWKISDTNGAGYAGAQIDWARVGSCAKIKVGFVGSGSKDFPWGCYNGNPVYDSKNNFGDGTKTNVFCTYWDPYRVSVMNWGNCGDCNRLWIHSITPIYRPFVFNLQDGDALKFLNADGTYSEYKDATFAALAGANNDTNNQVVRYIKEGKNSITVQQTIGKNISTPYVYIKRIDMIKDGWTKLAAGYFGDDGASSRTFTLTQDWLDNRSGYIYFEENNSSNAWKNQSGTYGLRARVELKPVFDYKNAEVKINVPSNNFGYFKISGSEKNISSSQTLKYHRGDILKLSTVMRDEYKDFYEPAGYKVSYKHNKSDTNWVKKDVIVPYSKDGGTSNFLDDNERLRYGYYEITPLFQKTGNTISVRVKKSDISKFDTSYGFFNTSVSQEVTVNGVTYVEYILYSKPVYGKIYAISARMNDSAGKSVYQRWTEPENNRCYGGEVFFHEASNSMENNVITLSCVAEKYADIYQSVKGSVFRPTYNMQTRQTGVTNVLPAQGAIVNFGGTFSVVDENGAFETDPFRAMNNYAGSSDRHYIRYVISVNGEESLEEMELLQTSGENKKVSVVSSDSGESKISEATVWVNPQNVGQKLINTENGSIINNIEVYTDNISYGNNLIIDGDSITVKAKMREPVKYTKVIANKFGELIEYPDTDENVTGVKFIIYDTTKNTQIASYDAENKNGEFVADIPLTQALPGNRLYISVTTDRSHGIFSETEKIYKSKVFGIPIQVTETVRKHEEQMNRTTYSDVFTGYTFVQKTTEEVPVLQHVDLPIDMKFDSLPLIGSTAMQFDLPFCSVGTIKTDTGYRLYIGASPAQIADTVKGTHMTSYAGDTGAYYKDLFSIKHPIQSFKDGLAASYKEAFSNVSKAYEGATSALGAPTWKMDVQVGVYFDFVYTSISNPNNGDKDNVAVFTGVGGYVGVSAGVKMAWYTIIPVVFIPAYFGIDISGNVLGFFGAGTDTSKPKITWDQAGNATVDFDNVLGEFNASVKMAATVQVYVGVGLAGTLGLRGGGTFNAMGLWEPSDLVSDWGADLNFTAGIWVDLFLFTVPLQYSFPDIKFGSFKEYENLTVNPTLMSAFGEDTPEFTVRQPYSSEPSEWLPSEISLQSAFSETSSQTIVANGYEHPDTQLLKLSDGGTFMAFLDSDTSRDSTERTVLKYSVYKNGNWSEPKVVQNDDKADFQPSVCEMKDGKVMISWLSSDPEKSTTEDSAEYLSNLEVYTAVIDTQSGDITEETRLTNDGYYDYAPTSVYDDETGDRIVYYVKTASKGSAKEMVNSYANDCVVVYMLYSADQGKWLFDYYYDNEVANDEARDYLIKNWKGQRFLSSPISELGIDVPNIADFTAISYNGIAVYGYTIDKDSSNDTSYDKELFVQCYDFKTHSTYVPIRITNDNVSDALPQFVRSGSGEQARTKLFWYRNEKDVAYIDISSLIKNGVNEDGTIKDDYLTGGDGEEKKDIESLYSYVSTATDNYQGSRSMADFRAVVDGDDIYVVWTQPVSSTKTDDNGNCKQIREVYATALIQDESATENKDMEDSQGRGECAWADPYRLTYTEAFTDEPNAIVDSEGNLMVLYNSYNQTITNDPGNPVSITNFSLKASYMEPCGSVDVVDMVISDLTPDPNDTVDVAVNVKNTGLTYAEGYKIDIYEMKDGNKGQLVKTIEADEKLLPGNINGYDFEWTIPETVEGVSLCAVVQEKGMTNVSEFESEPLAVKAVYSIDSLNAYQDDNGYHLDYTVTNSGNAASDSSDTLKVMFTGPYSMSLDYSDEECNFATAALDGIGAGETKTFTTDLKVISSAFDKYGFIDCLVIGVDKNGKYITDGENIRLVPSRPLELLLNGEPMPSNIEIAAGETIEFNVTCEPQILSDAIKTTFGTENASVAAFDGNTLKGLTAGTTTIYGSVTPFGTAVENITVTVSGETKDTSDNYPVEKTSSSGRSSGGNTKYTVTLNTNGGNALDALKVTKNSVVGELETPIKEGYVFAGWYLDEALTSKADLNAKVTNDMTLYAKWAEKTPIDVVDAWENPFIDVKPDDWFYNDVGYANQNGLFSGISENSFAPNDDLTRAMLVTVLYRAEGQPEIENTMKFTDVSESDYYADAVTWAEANGIVNGVSEKEFAPNDKITREQIAAIMYRYAIYKGIETVTLEENLAFTDAGDISEYAVSALNWTVRQEIFKGYDDETIRPQNNATRAEAAAVLRRFLDKLSKMKNVEE